VKRLFLAALLLAAVGAALSRPAEASEASPILAKLQPYIECLNGFSERAFSSRSRYASWAAESGPTGKEMNIYGTYTISDPRDCGTKIDAANGQEPHEPALETAGTAYAGSLIALAPLLKEADAYYSAEDYKDDKMAKGKAMHPKLLAAWSDFAKADDKLRDAIETLQDQVQQQELAEIEKTEGRARHYFALNLMITAKQLLHVESSDEGTPDLDKIQAKLQAYEAATNDLDQYAANGKESGIQAAFLPMLVSSAKDYLTTAKKLMRRIRDKTPYSTGEKMNLSNHLSGWMVEGSPPRLIRDYNQLVESFNHL
jgi:hypothetical protein